jgi:hypothetical protein
LPSRPLLSFLFQKIKRRREERKPNNLPMRGLLISLCILAGFLSGCDSTGGSIGNLVPAPKFLKGSIKDGVYSAPDHSFSITVPQKADSYEYKYMNVKERYSSDEVYVSFGPAALDHTIYRLDIGKRLTAESRNVLLDDIMAARLIALAKTPLRAAYKGELVEMSASKDTINGKPCYHWQFKQTVPSGIMFNNKPAELSHDVYAMDVGIGVASIWVQSLEGDPASGISARAFAESLLIH